jgi:hypothetical protein
LLEVSLRRFTSGKGSLWMWRWPLVEVSPVCDTADAHKPPHVLGRVATTTVVHVDVLEFHFAPLQLQFMLWQHSADVCRATLVVLWLSCHYSWSYALTWTLCCRLLMCVCEVQFSSWQKQGQYFEHAVRLCTIPLVLYNMLHVVMLSVWVV